MKSGKKRPGVGKTVWEFAVAVILSALREPQEIRLPEYGLNNDIPFGKLSRTYEKFMKLMKNPKIQAIVEKMAPKE